VTEEQNEFLYNLLGEFEKETGIGVLLNTSFNLDGKPVTSTIKDAIDVLTKTKMDGLVIENVYIQKY
jgi:carbamoyltransferase